jgi:hypothetical protein
MITIFERIGWVIFLKIKVIIFVPSSIISPPSPLGNEICCHSASIASIYFFTIKLKRCLLEKLFIAVQHLSNFRYLVARPKYCD